MLSFTPVFRAFGFFNNDGGPIAATAAAAQDTNIVTDVDSGNVGRHLRTQIQETGGAAGTAGDAYKLQAEKNDSGTWFDVTTSSSGVRAFDSTLIHGNGVTTSRLSGGTGTFESTGRCTETGVTSSAVVGASNYIENIYGIEVVAADVANNDTFDFRVLLNGATFTNSVTPRITVAKTPPASSGKAKVWDGAAWAEKPLKVWDGAAWVEKPLKVWNGSAWVLA